MRVGVYVAGYSPQAGGGYTFETDVLDGLMACVSETTHKFCVLTPKAAAVPLRRYVTGSGLDVQAVADHRIRRWLAALWRDSAFVRAHLRRPSALDRAAVEAQVDFIWFVGAGARRTDVPYLTVVWDLQHRVTPWFPEMTAKGLWDGRELSNQWFLPRAAAVITGTRIGAEELERYYQIPRERVLILPHPTPRFALENAVGRDEGTAQRLGIQAPYLLYPAQFWPHKNHVNLLHALALLRGHYGVNIELALVGSDKGNQVHVQSMARALNISTAVHTLGFVSRSDLVNLYRNAAALAYTSWCGPENLPPLEAFALGCPVVATRIPGAEEQLGKAALLVDPGSPAEMAAAIKTVIDDASLRERLIAAGHERAKRWTAREYVRGVFGFLDRFEAIRRCWT
jgi:glycosyltransferase involved in cell wall biosynthesis